MAARRLNQEQRNTLLTWLAADYDWQLIVHWFREQGWPEPSLAAASYYRRRFRSRIEELRAERLDSALSSGLALKEERVARLKAHADQLERLKWQENSRGEYPLERAWRETLGDIAKEMGHRKQAVEMTVERIVREYAGVEVDEV